MTTESPEPLSAEEEAETRRYYASPAHRLGPRHGTVGDDAAAVSLFYIGLAIGSRDPERGRQLLRQIEREMAAAGTDSPETVEVRLRAAADAILPFLAIATEEPA